MPEALAAPPAPAAPSPAPAPASLPSTGDTGGFSAAFPDDGLDSPEPAAAPPTPEPSPKPGEGAAMEPPPHAAPPEPKPEAGAPAPVPSPDFDPPKVAKPSELRTWANRMGQRAKKAEDELKTLAGRMQQLESSPRQPAVDQGPLAQELAAAKKQLAGYEGELRLSRYERSAEYKEKFQQPYQQAVKRAYREVKELIAYSPNPDSTPDDPRDPIEREATTADFDEIYSALTTGQAVKRAKQLFGDAAMSVIGHRQKIKELAEAAYGAVEEYKGKGSQYEKAQQARNTQFQEGMSRMFDLAREGYQKKFSDAFAEREGDTEGNDLLGKARQFAQAVFAGNDGLSPQQVAMRDARAFNWLTAHPRLMRDLKKARAELAASKKTIETIRGSGPGKPGISGESGPKKDEKEGDVFDRMVNE